MHCPRPNEECTEISCGWNRNGICDGSDEQRVDQVIVELMKKKRFSEGKNKAYPDAYQAGKATAYTDAVEIVKRLLKGHD